MKYSLPDKMLSEGHVRVDGGDTIFNRERQKIRVGG